MKRFNALKKVNAKPMTRQEYNNMRGWDLPADEDGSDQGYLTEDMSAASNLDGWDGFISWVPKVMFDEQFYEVGTQVVGESVKDGWTASADRDHELPDEEIKVLASGSSFCDFGGLAQDKCDFGSAIYLLKSGKKVMRKGWNGKAMFLYYVPAASYPMQRNSLETMAGEFEGDLVPYGAYIAMKTAQNNVVPWLASQTDVLAIDWCLA